MVRRSRSERVFDAFNILFMCLMIFITLYPFYYLICASFSDNTQLLGHTGLLWKPVGFTTGAYRLTFRYPLVASGYRNTLIILACALPLNMLLTLFCAYCLAARNMLLKKFIVSVVMFTMFFSGGLIPAFLNVRSLGLYNSLAALILPGALSIYNSIIVKTALEALPDSLAESAYLDGANDFHLLFRILAPLILPTLAVIVLYYAVGHWNAWFAAVIYLNDNQKLPIQAVMRAILIENTNILSTNAISDQGEINRFAETIKYALVIVGTIPILVVYPFVQRFFVKGVMIGAVKG